MNVAEVRNEIVRYLNEIGFAQADADETDLRHTDASLRFKVGTSYNEVAVVVLFASKMPNQVFRINHESQIPATEAELRGLIDRHWTYTPITENLRGLTS